MVNVAPKRRWFRFSLRTLFVVVAVFAVWLGWNVRQIRTRDVLLKSIQSRGATIYQTTYNGREPSLRLPPLYYIIGCGPIGCVWLRDDRFTEDDVQAVKRTFPEAEVGLVEMAVQPPPSTH
jgi:hypothetical protein